MDDCSSTKPSCYLTAQGTPEDFNQDCKDSADSFPSGCDDSVNNDCFYGSTGSSVSTWDDPCLMPDPFVGQTRGSFLGTPVGSDLLPSSKPAVCVHYAEGSKDALFNCKPFLAVERYVPMLLSDFGFYYDPCVRNDSCPPEPNDWVYRVLLLWAGDGYRIICNFTEKCDTPPCDQYQLKGLWTGGAIPVDIIPGQLAAIWFNTVGGEPYIGGPYADWLCYTNNDGHAGSSNVGVDANALDNLDVFLSARYGTDNEIYPWTNERSRDLLNAAWKIVSQYFDKMDSPGHGDFRDQKPKSSYKSTWLHGEPFDGTKPPSDPLPARPIVVGTEDYYPEYLGESIPITLRGIVDRNIAIAAHLTIIGIEHSRLNLHIEKQLAVEAVRVTGDFIINVQLGVRIEKWDNPYGIVFMGMPGAPRLASFVEQQIIEQHPDSLLRLTISNAPQALNLKPLIDGDRADDHVVFTVTAKGDFADDADNILIKIDGNLIGTVFDNSRDNTDCNGGTVHFAVNSSVWNTYADGETDVEVTLEISGSVELNTCPEGTDLTLRVRYMEGGTPGNRYDLRILDTDTGLESEVERLIAYGPNMERVPMQERDGGRFHTITWEALHTSQLLSRGHNAYMGLCGNQSPGGGNCCDHYIAIEQAVLWGRTNDNRGLGLTTPGVFDVLPQRYEGALTLDIDDDGCFCA